MSLRVQTSSNVADIATSDAFVNKAGDWSFTQAIPPTVTETNEIQGRFALAPMDVVVMDALEAHVGQMTYLPSGHQMDSALERLYHQLPEGEVKTIIGAEVDLRAFFALRRIEEIGV